MPDSNFSQIWQIVIAILLLYTATMMPYKTCFKDDFTFTEELTDWIVDILFMFDIYVNFMSALEYQDGSKETNLKVLAKNYTRSWFAFDLISVIPF